MQRNAYAQALMQQASQAEQKEREKKEGREEQQG